MSETIQHPAETDLRAAMNGLLSSRAPAPDADPQAADLEGLPEDGANIDIEDPNRQWSDAEIAAAEEPFTEDDVKAALARSTPGVREMLSAQDANA